MPEPARQWGSDREILIIHSLFAYDTSTHPLSSPMIHPLILLAVFAVSTVLGYVIIRQVPSLLHTPLMSGMNALSGITIVGAIAATGIALKSGHGGLAQVVGGLAIILAAVNVFGGFGVTHRMLMMFQKKKKS